MLSIDSRLELFTDRLLIDRLQDASLKLHRPTPVNTAFRFDRRYEGAFSGYSTIIRDGDRFLLYYRGWPAYPNPEPDQRPILGPSTFCRAESWDGGQTFHRPNYGLVEIEGSRDNNVLLTGEGDEASVVHNLSPFLDTRPGVDPRHRFKAMGGSIRSGGLRALSSPDGIHWSLMSPDPVFSIEQKGFDSQNVPFWSEAEGRYLLYYRIFKPVGDPPTDGGPQRKYRWICRAVSEDFLHWTHEADMTFGDTPPEEFYTNQTHPYFRAPHLYIAMPKRFMSNRPRLSAEAGRAAGLLPPYHKDLSDCVLMTSRAGTCQYDRTFMESFIRPGPDPVNWGSRTNMSVLGVHPTGPREMSIYCQHGYASSRPTITRYTMRTDGFISVHAGYGGGELVTRPLTFIGNQLVLNMETGGGPANVRVEIQDEAGKPIAGYSLDECPEHFGDEIEQIIRWKGGDQVGALAGRPVRLRFVMRDADVYSLRFR